MKTINKFNMSAVSQHIQNWELIDWKKIFEYVKKLRQRIFRAEQLGLKRKVRKLQRLMIEVKLIYCCQLKELHKSIKAKRQLE